MENLTTMQTVYTQLKLTAVFKGTLTSPLLLAFFRFMEAFSKAEKLGAYASFVSEIYEGGGSLTEVCRRMVFEDENVYVKSHAKGISVDENIKRSAERELKTFSSFAALTPEAFGAELNEPLDSLPLYHSEQADFVKEYEARLNELGQYGYGIFSSSAMFRLSDEGKLERIVKFNKKAPLVTKSDILFQQKSVEPKKGFSKQRGFG